MTTENKGALIAIEGWNVPGIIMPEKFRGSILHFSSLALNKRTPTIIIRHTAHDQFMLESEKLGWWHEYRARVIISQYDQCIKRFSPIGWYYIDALAMDNAKCVWKATFRRTDLFDYGKRLNLTAMMAKSWAEVFFRHSLAEQIPNEVLSVSSDDDSVTIAVTGTESVPSGIVRLKTNFKGPDNSAMYESIGRIEMALRELEGEICLALGHISLSPGRMVDCPKGATFGTHITELCNEHTHCSCTASALHNEFQNAIKITKDEILAWRNGFAHGLPAFDAPMIENICLGVYDEETKTFIRTENIPQHLLLIRDKGEDIELTPETLNRMEKKIIDAWAIIKLFNLH